MVVHTDDELLTVEEVAQLLKVPTSWVYDRCRESASAQLPHMKLGKYLRFRKSDLFRYLENLQRGDSRKA
jgi:excisionase family DNA binding protein